MSQSEIRGKYYMPWSNYRDSRFNLIWKYAVSLYVSLAISSWFL